MRLQRTRIPATRPHPIVTNPAVACGIASGRRPGPYATQTASSPTRAAPAASVACFPASDRMAAALLLRAVMAHGRMARNDDEENLD